MRPRSRPYGRSMSGNAWMWEKRENRPEVWQLAFDWATDNGIDPEDFADFYLSFAHPDNDPEPFHIAVLYWSEPVPPAYHPNDESDDDSMRSLPE